MRLVLILYTAFLASASLFSFSGWAPPDVSPWEQFLSPSPSSTRDWVLNVLVYAPLGWLVVVVAYRAGVRRPLALALAAGSGLSLLVELEQGFLPGRVPSYYDWIANTAGTLAGAGFAWALRDRPALLGRWLAVDDPRVRVGVAAVGFWAAAELFPFIPSLRWARRALGALRFQLAHIERLDVMAVVATAAAVYAIVFVLGPIARPAYRGVLWRIALVGLAFAAKLPVLRSSLRPEEIAGFVVGSVLFALVGSRRAGTAVCVAALAVVIGLERIGTSASWELTGLMRSTIPRSSVFGLRRLLELAWPFVTLAFLGLRSPGWPSGWSPTRRALGGGLAVAAAVLALDVAAGPGPGRGSPAYDALFAAWCWTLPWLYVRPPVTAAHPGPPAPAHPSRSDR